MRALRAGGNRVSQPLTGRARHSRGGSEWGVRRGRDGGREGVRSGYRLDRGPGIGEGVTRGPVSASGPSRCRNQSWAPELRGGNALCRLSQL